MSPFKPKRPCNYSGCKEITNERYCPKHDHLVKQKQDEERGSASERGYNHGWHKVSEMHLREFPLCAECERQGKTTAATMTHHIKRIVDGGDKLAWDNLESLCVECHDVKHKGDRWGK